MEKDINEIIDNGYSLWGDLKNKNIFLTGGTGFIGIWLLNTIIELNRKNNANISVTVLSRNIDRFKEKHPEVFSSKNISFISGDICNFQYPKENFTHIIHGATDASADLNEKNPYLMYSTIVDGTKNILNFAKENKDSLFLFMSSGAVYGNQPFDLDNVDEEFLGGPDIINTVNCYAESKRAAEMLCSIYCKQYNINVKIARIFALLGPYLSLDIHFAAGNFIRDALEGREIIVKGNGKPVRSYLYPTDLIFWLFYILIKGRKNAAYNVGSPYGYSIEELAIKVANLIGNKEYQILGKKDGGWNLGRYVPDITLIKKESNYDLTVDIDEAIIRTAIWNKK
ncbi:MAG: NAD(P)-dependent oxidoreductase [Gammaproteobacteria bacterium]|nr:NAD(P)-dependent oxidoreductase [Gammaproteobacteria bacterium]